MDVGGGLRTGQVVLGPDGEAMVEFLHGLVVMPVEVCDVQRVKSKVCS